jgi:magnesium chelatase family protein
MIHSVGGELKSERGLITHPPFRSPHHTSSDVALVGGGTIPSVGEVSLSHNGVLFLDEFVEFKSNVIQALRQPLEDYEITVSRALGTFKFPRAPVPRTTSKAIFKKSRVRYWTGSTSRCW